MLKKFLAVTAVAAIIPAAASAQQVREAIPYVGAAVGYHQLEEIDAADFGGTDDVSIDGFTYGGYAGVHVPMGETLIVGVEGNFNLGTGTIDSEYGATAHIGTMLGENSMLFARAGYQWVNVDRSKLADDFADTFGFAGTDRDDFVNGFRTGFGSDVEGDYLVGVGGEFGVGESSAFRLTVDTISFDTLRLGAGYSIRF